MARTRSVKNAMPPEGSWIKYQLDLRNIKLEEVAKKANRSLSMVSQVITGVKKSEAVGETLAQMLGYVSWSHLYKKAFLEVRKAV